MQTHKELPTIKSQLAQINYADKVRAQAEEHYVLE